MGEHKLIQEIDNERLARIENDQWVNNIANAFAQQYHFKASDINRFNKTNFISDLPPLFINLVDLSEDEFKIDTKNMKESLVRSTYALENAELFRKYTNELVVNDSSSFIMIPLSFKTEKSSHLVTASIQKKAGFFQIEIFDKAGIAPPERSEKSLVVKNREQMKRKVSYIYEIKDTEKNFAEMIYALENGRGEFNIPLDINNKKLNYKEYIPLRLLSKVATKEYYGDKIRSAQIIGNCCVKSWTGALKDKLEQFRIEQSKPSNESLNKILTEIACRQLEKAGYGPKTIYHFRELNSLYSYNKIERKDMNNKFSKKQENSRLFNQYFTETKNKLPLDRIALPMLNASLKHNHTGTKYNKLKKLLGKNKTNDSTSIYFLTDLDKQKIIENVGTIVSHHEIKKTMDTIKKEVQRCQQNRLQLRTVQAYSER